MEKTLRNLAMFALVLTAYCQLPAASVPSADEMPTQTFDDKLSTIKGSVQTNYSID
jgi:hypothetical protein